MQIAQICRFFDCLPWEAQRELEEGDAGLVHRVMEAMAYMDAYRRINDYSDKDKAANRPYPSGPMVEQVQSRMGRR